MIKYLITEKPFLIYIENGFFMVKCNQIIVKDFVKVIKNDFKIILSEFKIEYNEVENIDYLYLATIKIKKSERNKGYGKVIMMKIIEFSKLYKIKIKLFPSNIYGSDLTRLHNFYLNFGFFLDEKKEYMYFLP